jgi:hypothetical protein
MSMPLAVLLKLFLCALFGYANACFVDLPCLAVSY